MYGRYVSMEWKCLSKDFVEVRLNCGFLLRLVIEYFFVDEVGVGVGFGSLLGNLRLCLKFILFLIDGNKELICGLCIE